MLAATFKSVASKEGKVIVYLTGEIVLGDAANISSAIKAANSANKVVSGVRLNSPGGNLNEGVKIAEVVRFAKIATNVASGGKCASACFLIFAAGADKFVNYNAIIGVHGASNENGSETVQSNAATISMARVAKELGVPASIIGKMVVTPPTEMVWLTQEDLRLMGAIMVGKPTQTPQASPQTAGPPMQLSPGSLDTKASAPANPVPTWNEFLGKAAAVSARQNGGKPNFVRRCQPAVKICNTGLFYKDTNGTETLLREEEDITGKIIQREVCTFNSFGDVRSCFDWDSSVKHRDMKDAKGEWQKVADE